MTAGPVTNTNAGEGRADAGLCTLAELPGRVAALLAGNYGGQRSGRIGELPTERSIRWYATTGLVDRPMATRNRVALYGPRHVLQLASIKKLQSEGRSLAEIQQRLLGASDAALAQLIGVPRPVAEPAAPREVTAPAGFWKRGAVAERGRAEAPAAPAAPAVRLADAVAVAPAVRLNDSVTLVLGAASRVPDPEELARIARAAAPLLDLLAGLGLAPEIERRVP
jgi:DNA-binding transcriptional MerR regulator